MSNELLRQEFLQAISEQQYHETYARIIALDINEIPIDSIEGKITQGSINVDGDSVVRRTCSLTMVSDTIHINEYYWGLKTKFKLEIGLRNYLQGEYAPSQGYPEVVWFPQGIYIISSFNTSFSTNSCIISLQGKDKMRLLNGDMGGQLFASIDFGTEDTESITMDQIELNTSFSSSREIMNNVSSYYIKPITDFTFNDASSISENDERYIFVLNQKTGNYYKDGSVYKPANGYRYENNNIYKRGTGQPGTPSNNPYFYYLVEPNDLERDSTKKYYDMYKKIEDPNELFQDVYFFKLKKYRRWNNSANNIINVSSYDDESTSDYKERYILIKVNDISYALPVNIKDCNDYEKRKYYIQNDNQNNYYILNDSKAISEEEEEKNQYELVPIYSPRVEVERKKINLKKIIREAVHTYAGEPYHNIIINDLEEYGLEQMTYKGDVFLYALQPEGSDEFTNMYIDNGTMNIALKNEVEKNGFKFKPLVNDIISESDFDTVTIGDNENEKKYYVARFKYGDDIGYRLTDLIYPDDLISSPGDTLTSILDKIKTVLTDFEYFYDINGKFIFQKKKIYVNTSWTQLVNNQDEFYVDFANNKAKLAYTFKDSYLFSAIQNSPNLGNLRNDYVVWGKRKTLNNVEIPIHARYAIDKKPVYYKNLNNQIFISKEYEGEEIQNSKKVDWREIIYQMALDYFRGQGCSEDNPVSLGNNEYLTSPDNFLFEVGRRNKNYYPSGYTGYEQYYTDIEGFWPELYNTSYTPKIIYSQGEYQRNEDVSGRPWSWKQPEIEDLEIKYYITKPTNLNIPEELENKYEKYFVSSDSEKLYWNIDVFEDPASLNFWIDFLDDESELGQFSTSKIGDRTKVVNEDKAKSIVYPEIPNFILYNKKEDNLIDSKFIIEKNSGYNFINLPNGFSQYFNTSYKSFSVKNKIDELLYQHSYCVDSISITSIPIYYLQPNTLISVQDERAGIDGEYILTRFSIPLTYNGTMSITANKNPGRII